jgi:hypothetical protein
LKPSRFDLNPCLAVFVSPVYVHHSKSIPQQLEYQDPNHFPSKLALIVPPRTPYPQALPPLYPKGHLILGRKLALAQFLV